MSVGLGIFQSSCYLIAISENASIVGCEELLSSNTAGKVFISCEKMFRNLIKTEYYWVTRTYDNAQCYSG